MNDEMTRGQHIESCEFKFNKQRNNNPINLQDENEEQLINGTKSSNDISLRQWSLILYPNGNTERFKEFYQFFWMIHFVQV
jgi:hypothetical protein